MSDRDYCYPPDFIVLRNRLGIRVARTLDAAERQFVAQRLLEVVPTGEFDLAHLKAIHRHLFQDVYDWAGELRTVEIAKGDSRFQPRRFIKAGMADIHRRIVAAGYFRGTGPDTLDIISEYLRPLTGLVGKVLSDDSPYCACAKDGKAARAGRTLPAVR